jgi:hypothetical protein
MSSSAPTPHTTTKTAAAETPTTHWTAYTTFICDSLKQLTLGQQTIMNALGVSVTKNTAHSTGSASSGNGNNSESAAKCIYEKFIGKKSCHPHGSVPAAPPGDSATLALATATHTAQDKRFDLQPLSPPVTEDQANWAQSILDRYYRQRQPRPQQQDSKDNDADTDGVVAAKHSACCFPARKVKRN